MRVKEVNDTLSLAKRLVEEFTIDAAFEFTEEVWQEALKTYRKEGTVLGALAENGLRWALRQHTLYVVPGLNRSRKVAGALDDIDDVITGMSPEYIDEITPKLAEKGKISTNERQNERLRAKCISLGQAASLPVTIDGTTKPYALWEGTKLLTHFRMRVKANKTEMRRNNASIKHLRKMQDINNVVAEDPGIKKKDWVLLEAEYGMGDK